MDGTRRFWRGAGGVAILLATGVAADRPSLLLGATALGTFLLASQVGFLRRLTALQSTLDVDQAVSPDRVSTTDAAQVTLSVSRPDPGRDAIIVRLRPPAGVRVRDADALTTTLATGDLATSAVATVEAPVAGTHAFDPPEVTVVDGAGRFRETFPLGDGATLRAEPPVPDDLHVGRGGEAYSIGFGDHVAGQRGTGLEPAELREYQSGDAANRIAWKATARLDETYVRDFEAETDRTVAIVMDCRPSMAAGAAGRTQFDYARAVALSVVDRARRSADPVALTLVDEGGITATTDPAATRDHYETVRSRLDGAVAGSEGSPPGFARTPVRSTSPGAAQQRAAFLADDETAFARTLRPYVDTTDAYVERVADDPLFAAVRARVVPLGGTVRAVIVTDDANPAEVFEAASLARSRSDHVTVFVLPSVLYEAGALADLEAAYERYHAFEEFRRRLDGLDGVDAVEVGPGDRLDAVLSARREGRA